MLFRSNKYEKPDAYAFSEALGYLVNEMTGPENNGLIDVLGKFFEENISHGHNGQFFSPEHICDLMARINLPDKPGSRIADPACGSGRLLMAMARYNRSATFYGADIDENCAKMAAINLCLNGMFGEIAWMDSLANKFYGAWEIVPHIKGYPYLKAIRQFESYIYMRLPEDTVHPAKKDITLPLQKELIFEF